MLGYNYSIWFILIEVLYEINHALCQAKRIIQFREIYKEKTNVFCYYFIKAVFLSDIDYFVKWCKNCH